MWHFNQLVAYCHDLAGKSRQHPDGWGERSSSVTLLMWKNDNSIIFLPVPVLKSFALIFVFPLLFFQSCTWDMKLSFYPSPSDSSLAGRLGPLTATGWWRSATTGSANGPQALYYHPGGWIRWRFHNFGGVSGFPVVASPRLSRRDDDFPQSSCCVPPNSTVSRTKMGKIHHHYITGYSRGEMWEQVIS